LKGRESKAREGKRADKIRKKKEIVTEGRHDMTSHNNATQQKKSRRTRKKRQVKRRKKARHDNTGKDSENGRRQKKR
jgi:hypothetical protein